MTDPSQRILQLLADVAGLEWMDWALCAETDPDAFFPEKGHSAEPAKAICRNCPVQEECRDDAMARMGHLETGRFGIWGGTSVPERDDMRGDAAA
jgi:WhiB family redox-sensing transcriptional regulator